MSILLIILLATLFVIAVVVIKVVDIFTLKELKRQAAHEKESNKAKIYNLAAYGSSTKAVLGLASLAIFSFLIFTAAQSSWWLMALYLLAASWLVLVWQPHKSSGWYWSISGYVAPFLARLISWVYPLSSKLISNMTRAKPIKTYIYEKNDLANLLKKQLSQSSNRIPEIDLKLTAKALNFGDKRVSDVMVPKRRVTFVQSGDDVGPKLMDELHSSGSSCFPVVRDSKKSPQVIGTVFLRDLLDNSGVSKVSDVMDKKVFFINESENLRSCLGTFLKTHHLLLIVVNHQEEIVGAVSLEDVLEQLFGNKLNGDFDEYENLQAVAALDYIKLKHEANTQKATPENAPTVVE